MSYQRFDQNFVDSVKEHMLKGSAVYIVTDSGGDQRFWLPALDDNQLSNIIFNDYLEEQPEMAAPVEEFGNAAEPDSAREPSHLMFTYDVKMLRQCDSIIGNRKVFRSSTRHGRPGNAFRRGAAHWCGSV